MHRNARDEDNPQNDTRQIGTEKMRTHKIAIITIVLGLALLLPFFGMKVEASIGGTASTGMNFGPILPGQSGSKVVTIQNNSSNSGLLFIWISEVVNNEGTKSEFEPVPGATGELGKYLRLGVISTRIETNVSMPAIITDFPQSPSSLKYIRIPNFTAGESLTLVWQWDLPSMTGNTVQGDTLSFKINYGIEFLQVATPSATPTASAVPFATATPPVIMPPPSGSNPTATPVPTETPTPMPTETPTPVATETSTPTVTVAPTATETPTPIASATTVPTATKTATLMAIATKSPTPTVVPAATATSVPPMPTATAISATPTPTEIPITPVATAIPEDTATPEPTVTETAIPSPTPILVEPTTATPGPEATMTLTPTATPRTIQVDLQGATSTGTFDNDGRLSQELIVESIDGKAMLTLETGATVKSVDTNEPPVRIVVVSAPVTMVTSTEEVSEELVALYEVNAYDSDGTKTDITLDPPMLLVLTYDPDSLPAGTRDVYIGWFDSETDTWTRMPAAPDYKPGEGELATLLSHFSYYAVIVDAPPYVFTYSMSLTNEGLNDAANVSLQARVPDLWRVVSISSSSGQTTIGADRIVRADIGTINSRESVLVSMTITIERGVKQGTLLEDLVKQLLVGVTGVGKPQIHMAVRGFIGLSELESKSDEQNLWGWFFPVKVIGQNPLLSINATNLSHYKTSFVVSAESEGVVWNTFEIDLGSSPQQASGSIDITLDGTHIGTTNIDLAPGEQKRVVLSRLEKLGKGYEWPGTVKWNYWDVPAGRHTVDVAGLEQQLTVDMRISWWLILIFIGATLLAVFSRRGRKFVWSFVSLGWLRKVVNNTISIITGL